MARKTDQYVVGILFPKKTETIIRYVTRVQIEPKVARWDDGEPAITFSKNEAKDLAFGLCLNGYVAIPMLKENYLNLVNPDTKEEAEE